MCSACPEEYVEEIFLSTTDLSFCKTYSDFDKKSFNRVAENAFQTTIVTIWRGKKTSLLFGNRTKTVSNCDQKFFSKVVMIAFNIP